MGYSKCFTKCVNMFVYTELVSCITVTISFLPVWHYMLVFAFARFQCTSKDLPDSILEKKEHRKENLPRQPVGIVLACT